MVSQVLLRTLPVFGSLLIGPKVYSMRTILNEVALQKEWQIVMTNNVLSKKFKHVNTKTKQNKNLN